VFTSTLVVTMTKVNPNPQQGEGTIWFDSFVADTPPLSSASSTSIPISSTSLTRSSYGTSTSSSIVSGTQVPVTNPNNNTSSKSTPTGAIIGGVIAGLVIILVFIAFLLYHRRRRRPEQKALVQPHKPYFNGEVPPHRKFLLPISNHCPELYVLPPTQYLSHPDLDPYLLICPHNPSYQ